MKVKVDYLFSNNKKIGSRLISWGTKHLSNEKNTPSHIAILINERWVLESTLFTGVRVIPYKKWIKINNEVTRISCIKKHREYKEIKQIFKSIKNKKYDWFGVLYLTLYILLNKLFKKEIPKINKWESKFKYFCSEAVGTLTKLKSTSMKAPIQLLLELRG